MINIMNILGSVIKFITDPKNTRMLLLGSIVILILLLFRQCGKTSEAKIETKKVKEQVVRVKNNYEASNDSIKTYALDNKTMRSEKQGYELTISELKTEYNSLLGKLTIEKNKLPKVIIKTEYVVKEILTQVPVLVIADSSGNKLSFLDSLNHSKNNYRILSGIIPFTVDTTDTIPKVIPGMGNFSLELAMNLDLALVKDRETKKINILVDTDYPGVSFTQIEGASILDNPKNKKALRELRKNWSLGFQVGYGISVSGNNISTSPYFGLGLNYSPKFLQW
jgi:hypothetical protein